MIVSHDCDACLLSIITAALSLASSLFLYLNNGPLHGKWSLAYQISKRHRAYKTVIFFRGKHQTFKKMCSFVAKNQTSAGYKEAVVILNVK